MPQASAKGNPASHRMNNPRLAARRATSWARGQARKLKRKRDAEQAHRRNVETVAAGGMTPWQAARAKRRERRQGKQAKGR